MAGFGLAAALMDGLATIVVPFTSSFGDRLYPFELLVPAAECALREDSVTVCSQLRTVFIEHRIRENLDGIPAERLADVDIALGYSLGVTEV